MDFTLGTYKALLNTLNNQGYSFFTFSDFISNPSVKAIVIRHDVDMLPLNSLEFAKIQAGLGIRGTYYFRAIPENWPEKIIKEIADIGHEVGYHYEDVSLVTDRLLASGVKHQEEELAKIAIVSFTENLERLRKIVPIRTICMHGSPMRRRNSRLLWKYYDYHDFGIIGEPYFDVNFDEVLYLTDTGRCWDGDSVNVRDKSFNRKGYKVGAKDAKIKNAHVSRTPHPVLFSKFHSTFDVINAAERGKLSDKIMITFHPQRWTDKPMPWIKELVWQNVKNIAKYFIVKVNSE